MISRQFAPSKQNFTGLKNMKKAQRLEGLWLNETNHLSVRLCVSSSLELHLRAEGTWWNVNSWASVMLNRRPTVQEVFYCEKGCKKIIWRNSEWSCCGEQNMQLQDRKQEATRPREKHLRRSLISSCWASEQRRLSLKASQQKLVTSRTVQNRLSCD